MSIADIDFDFPQDFETEAYATTHAIGARFEIRRFLWNRYNEITFAPPCSYFELTKFDAVGRYLVPSFRDLAPQGEVRFYPAARPFHTRWRDREQRSLFCRIDIPAITGVPIELADEQLRATIDVRNGYIKALLRRAATELTSPGVCSQLVFDSISLSLATEMIQQFGGARLRARKRGARLDQSYLQGLAVRVREQKRSPGLQELAMELGVSPRQFERLFRAAAGESLASFCKRQVLRLAQDLLADRSLLIKEVAFRCGFANSASFGAAFRQMQGLTPQQYRDRSLRR